MTDPLDTDLQAMLARRAIAVTADVAGGEAAIATRLEAGDAGLAEVVAIRSARRAPLLVAAAAVVVVIIGAAVLLLTRNATKVDTGPAAGTPTTRAAVLEFRPVLSQFSCAGNLIDNVLTGPDRSVCYQVGDPLAGNALVERASVVRSFSSTGQAICEAEPCPGVESTSTSAAETFIVQLTLTPDGVEKFNLLATQCYERSSFSCPDGQLAVVVDDVVLSAPTIQQPSYERDAIQISTDLTEAKATALAASLDPTTQSTSAKTPGWRVRGDFVSLGAAREACADLPGIVDGSFGVTADLAPGELAEQLGYDVLRRDQADAVVDCMTGHGGIDVVVEAYEEPKSFERIDPLLGHPGESAKDVAERIALSVFGETFVALDATDEGLLTLVTMEGPSGHAIAEVIYDEAVGGERLVRISPDANGRSSGTITDGSLSFELPEPGDLTYAILDGDLNELFANTIPGLDGGVVGARGPVGENPRWMSVRLDTPDGRVLVWFSSLGD